MRKNIGPLKREDGSLILDDKEKACRMNTFFATIGNNLINSLPNAMDDVFCPEIQQCQAPQLYEFKIAHDSVREKVKQLKVKKSVGPDNIAPKLLKAAGNAIVPSLVNLYEFSIERVTVYSMWKTAKHIPIFKIDDETHCGNYRPISLLSVPSKIMESEINSSIVEHNNYNNLISERQWAYDGVTQLNTYLSI